MRGNKRGGRGGFSGGRQQQTALMRSQIAVSIPLSKRRLQKDYLELKES